MVPAELRWIWLVPLAAVACGDARYCTDQSPAGVCAGNDAVSARADAAADTGRLPDVQSGVDGGAEPTDSAVVIADDAGSTPACVPSAETCNGEDDDCDGRIDEAAVCGGRPLVAGGTHTCYARADGSTSCWGRNQDGQLGDGSEQMHLTPTATLAEDVVSLAASSFHTCALSAAGAVSCWGRNDSGQLGDRKRLPLPDSRAVRATPEVVVLPGLAIGVAVGSYHSCALLEDGTVYCWGANEGTFGKGRGAASSTPIRVNGLTTRALAIAGGYDHTCALLATRSVICWGKNSNAQLGDGTLAERDRPVTVTGLADVVELAAAGHHSCALSEGGVVSCWGLSRFAGETRTTTAVPVESAQGAVQLAVGYDHNCVVMADGSVRCWGQNVSGELGDGTMSNRAEALAVPGIAGAVQVATGTEHSCAVTAAGAVSCWGLNVYGQLGDGTLDDRLMPVSVAFP